VSERDVNKRENRQRMSLPSHLRLIINWVHVILVRLRLAFARAGAVRQQVEADVRIRQIVRVTRYQVPARHTTRITTHICNHLYGYRVSPKKTSCHFNFSSNFANFSRTRNICWRLQSESLFRNII